MPARTFAFAVLFAVGTVFAAAAAEPAVPGTYGDVLRWYFKAAEAGDASAQFLLGVKYETGTDVARDLSRAAEWYEKAARQGHTEAQFKLATLLQRGEGRAADPAAAKAWYERAARAGFAPAQYNHGVMLLNEATDDGGRIDGLAWLIKARDQGLAPAEKFLARLRALWPAELIAAAEQRVAGARSVDREGSQ